VGDAAILPETWWSRCPRVLPYTSEYAVAAPWLATVAVTVALVAPTDVTRTRLSVGGELAAAAPEGLPETGVTVVVEPGTGVPVGGGVWLALVTLVVVSAKS
jgi:hypothetical protein